MTDHNKILSGSNLATINEIKDVVTESAFEREFDSNKQLAYWRDSLGNQASPLRLPTDYPRTKAYYQTASFTVALPSELSDRLRSCAARENISTCLLLLAAFQVLLFRYTEQTDFVIGTILPDQLQNGLSGENSLPLHCQLTHDGNFSQLLSQSARSLQQAHCHNYQPLERLIEELFPQADISRESILPAFFAFESERSAAVSTVDFNLRLIERVNLPYELALTIVETGDGYTAHFHYHSGLFNAATITRMAGNFQTLLTSIADESWQASDISTLAILTPAERYQLLIEWNNTESAYPDNTSVHQLVEAQVERTPDAIALILEDQELSYQELNRRANQLAHYLQRLGVGPETIVALCFERSFEMVVAMLGVLKAGGAYLPLDATYPKERLAFMLADSNAVLILSVNSLKTRLPEFEQKIICLDTEWAKITGESSTNPTSAVTPENLACIIYTSGSTGDAKGVMIHHRGICNRLGLNLRAMVASTDVSVVLNHSHYTFINSVPVTFAALAVGASQVLAQSGREADTNYILQLVIKHKIRKLGLPISQVRLILDDPDIKRCSHLKYLSCAMEAMSPELKAKIFQLFPDITIFYSYGLTEATAGVSFWSGKRDDIDAPVSVGRPIMNTQVYILDRKMNPVPIGVAGEIYLSGVGLARGYLNREELTAAKFLPNPFDTRPNARLYQTGDRARYLADGNIQLLGRVDYQVKVRGFRVELGEVEAALSRHPALLRNVVIASKDSTGNQQLIAYLVSHFAVDWRSLNASSANYQPAANQLADRNTARRYLRVRWQANCQVRDGVSTISLPTLDLSAGGVCLTGVPADWQLGQEIELLLPIATSLATSTELLPSTGKVRWLSNGECGIEFVAAPWQPAEKFVADQLARHHLSVADLRAFLKESLPDYMVPSVFVMLDALPLFRNGKVNRHALPAPERVASITNKLYAAPRNPIEEVLCEIWTTLLQCRSVGIDENFFELGGHSLLATQLVSRIYQTFGLLLTVRTLFESPTIELLAAKIAVLREQASVKLPPPLVPVSREGELPVSFMQEWWWFLEHLDTGNPVFNLPFSYRLHGKLDLAALEKSLNEIIRRHETLRTSFITIEGQPIQRINAHQPFVLPMIDLTQLSGQEREARAGQIISDNVRQVFDLTQSPLLRALVVRLNEEEHVLTVTVHHIASDGWSLGVLIKELTTLYNAFAAGKPSPLPEIVIQYADFAHWQRNWLVDDVLEAKLGYWRKQLSGELPVLQLTTDHPRPSIQTFRGSQHSIVIKPELVEALNTLSRNEGVTLFITLLTAFKTLLMHYSGQQDIIVGSPAANRTRIETEGLIGVFANHSILRSDLSGNPTFRELLHRVREVVFAAYEHQDLPFEQIVEALHPERDPSRSPFFQTLFALHDGMRSDSKASFINLTAMPFHAKSNRGETFSRFDISLEMTAREQGLHGIVVYNRDLFEAATIERLFRHFQNLLEAIVQESHCPIAQLPLLSHQEREQLLVAWNNTAADYPKLTLSQLFEAQVARTPTTTALIYEDQQLTYAELNKRANNVAHFLRTLKIGPEVVVGICMERSVEMVVAVLGVLKAGGAYLPLDPVYPSERIAYMLEDANVGVLLTQRELIAQLPRHKARVCVFEHDWFEKCDYSNDNPELLSSLDSLTYLIYTSGSTGKPKGVEIPMRALINFLCSMQREPGLKADDTLLAVTSLSFDIAGLEIFLPLITGARLVLASRAVAADGRALLNYLKQCHATVMQATPSTWRMLFEAGWYGQLKVLCGGEALPPNLAKELCTDGREMWNLYGPTETTIWSACARLTNGARITIGRPIANTQIYILNNYFEPVPVGVAGELYIGGDGVARGYLNRPELTTERFVRNPFGEGQIYRTGDLARWLVDGQIDFLGRVDHQVKVRGHRIELGEIEAVLLHHSGVKEVVVIARNEKGGDQQLIAYLVSELAVDDWRELDEAYEVSDLRTRMLRVSINEVCQVSWPGTESLQLKAKVLSGGGLGLAGENDQIDRLPVGGQINILIQLPGLMEQTRLTGEVVWQYAQRAGIKLDVDSHQQELLQESIALVVERHELSVNRLRAFLREQLPEYMLPTHFILIDRMPLTPNGKLDRRALPEPEQIKRIERKFIAPRTPVETKLSEIWQKVLKLERVGIYDNFFELGGHSLLLTQVAAQVYSLFGVELPLREMFEVPTIVDMVEAIAARQLEHQDETELAAMVAELQGLSANEIQILLESEDLS